MSWLGGALPKATAAAGAGFTRSKMAPSRGNQFLSRFAGPLVGGLLGSRFGAPGGVAGTILGGALGTREAQEARRDPDASPFEFGLSEGLGSIWNAGREARRDQSSVWPELGVSEMIGKTFGADRAAPGDFVGGGTAIGGVGKAAGEFGVGSAVGAKAGDFLSRMGVKDNWIADTAGSPAAQAGFDPDERFQLQVNHQQWLKDRGRRYDTSFDSWLR